MIREDARTSVVVFSAHKDRGEPGSMPAIDILPSVPDHKALTRVHIMLDHHVEHHSGIRLVIGRSPNLGMANVRETENGFEMVVPPQKILALKIAAEDVGLISDHEPMEVWREKIQCLVDTREYGELVSCPCSRGNSPGARDKGREHAISIKENRFYHLVGLSLRLGCDTSP